LEKMPGLGHTLGSWFRGQMTAGFFNNRTHLGNRIRRTAGMLGIAAIEHRDVIEMIPCREDIARGNLQNPAKLP
jgi:hypothetical protein